MLLVPPESTETASLYYSDKEYGELERRLGTAGKGTRDKPPEAGLTAARQISVTWMVHDVSPWRLDRVYPVGDGKDVWIHTAANLDSTTNRRAQDASAAATDEATDASSAPLRASDGTGWGWALPGAAAGAVLALVLRPFAMRLPLDRLRGEPGPRQELRDV